MRHVLSQLLEKGTVKEVQDERGQFILTMFAIQQTNKIRQIQQIIEDKFIMESLDLVKTLMKGDYLMKLDLKYAYYSIHNAQDQKKYLRFKIHENTYEIQCLPLIWSSISSSSIYQTDETNGCSAASHRNTYSELRRRLPDNAPGIPGNLTELGFLVKREKCCHPTQEIVFQGALLYSSILN